MKGNKLIFFICIIFGILLGTLVTWILLNNTEGEKYIIPKNYIGEIVVFFNVKDGQLEEYENKTRIYRIPKNGILRTKFSFNTGMKLNRNITFFYEVGKTLKKIPFNEDIPYNIPNGIDTSQIFVFSKRYGTGETNYNNKKVTYCSFLVGNSSQSDSIFYNREKSHTPDKIDNTALYSP